MKKYNFKSIIAALVCACSLAFQAKAASYDISTVGSIKITSIASSTASNATIYNDGANPVTTTATTGVAAVFNFSGTITDISKIKKGDQITIPLTVASGSHFPSVVLSFNPNLSVNGQNLFTVSYSYSGGGTTVTLTATDAISGVSGEVDFNLQGSGTLYTTGGTLQQLQATATTFTLDNNAALSYTVNSAATTLSPINNCSAYLGNSPSATSTSISLNYIIACVYDDLLLNGASALTNPLLNNNFIEVATIPANTQISSITAPAALSTVPYMNFVMPDNSSVSGTNITNLTGAAAFTPVTVSDTSMANLEATMQPGQYAIVKYPDGSYAIAVDWGALLKNAYTQYAPGTSVASYDENSDALMQEAMTNYLSALIDRLYFTVNFANGAAQNSIQATVKTNLSDLFTTNSTTLNNMYVNNAPSGQGTAVVTYLNQYGAPIRQSIISYGWSQTSGNTATVLNLTPPKDTLGLTLLSPAQVQKLGIASKVGITSATVDTVIVYKDSSIYYIPPTNASGAQQVVQIYYVYGDLSTLPITGLQLTAQPKGNTVELSWGTLTEINSKTFTVQRSADEGKTWVTVNIQPTKALNGNSSVPLTYQLTDPTVPIGSYEYRVVETDVDGATTTSNVVQIVITGGGQVFPNPANTLLNVKLPAGASSVPYRLISADGKIVLKGTITNAGNYGQISVAGIASDIYFLQVTVNNTVQTYEVRIQH